MIKHILKLKISHLFFLRKKILPLNFLVVKKNYFLISETRMEIVNTRNGLIMSY